MKNIAALLTDALKKNNLSLSEQHIQLLVRYLELLQTWNKVFNLTNIIEPAEMVYLHIIDSLLIDPFLRGQHFLDVGSGAGLPGIPLAILHPEQQWTLLDKNSKKTRFMQQAVAELGLANASIMHARTEEFHPAQGFDSILSRAFASLAVFVTTTRHLLAPNGVFLAMKGKFPQEELAELSESQYSCQIEKIAMKGRDVERHIICIQPTN